MREITAGIIFRIAFRFLMKAVVMPLLGGPAINSAYHYLAGNPAVIWFSLYAGIIGAGFGEETMFRGYFFERRGKASGRASQQRSRLCGSPQTFWFFEPAAVILLLSPKFAA